MPVSSYDSSRSDRCLPCIETLAAKRPKVRPVKEDRAKKAKDLTGTIRCRARAPEWQRGPQVMDFAGEFQQYATSTIRTSGGSGVRRS